MRAWSTNGDDILYFFSNTGTSPIVGRIDVSTSAYHQFKNVFSNELEYTAIDIGYDNSDYVLVGTITPNSD